MHSPIVSTLSVFALGLEGVVSQLMPDRSHLVGVDPREKFERSRLTIFLLLINYFFLGFFFILGFAFCFFMMFDFMMFFFDLFAFYF